MYRHLLSKYFEKAVLGRLEMVPCQCFLWHQPDVCWKTCNMRKVFGSVSVAYYFQCQVRCGSSKTVLKNELYFSLVFVGFETFC